MTKMTKMSKMAKMTKMTKRAKMTEIALLKLCYSVSRRFGLKDNPSFFLNSKNSKKFYC